MTDSVDDGKTDDELALCCACVNDPHLKALMQAENDPFSCHSPPALALALGQDLGRLLSTERLQCRDCRQVLIPWPRLAGLPVVDRQSRNANQLAQRLSRQAEPPALRGKSLRAESMPAFDFACRSRAPLARGPRRALQFPDQVGDLTLERSDVRSIPACRALKRLRLGPNFAAGDTRDLRLKCCSEVWHSWDSA